MSRSARATIFALAAASIACGTAPPGSESGSRDSSGIAITESVAPAWGDAGGWRVSSDPILDLGVEAGDAAYEFFRAEFATRLSDGRLVVGNVGSLELRYFAPDGTYLHSAGSEGAGPGEFRSLWWVGPGGGDTIVAYDGRNRRISVFSPAGEFVRAVSLVSERSPRIAGRTADGSYVGTHFHFRVRGAPPPPLGPGRDTLSIVRFEADGSPRDTLQRGLWRLNHVVTLERGGRTLRPGVPLPFSPTTLLAARDSRIVVATTDRMEVRWLDMTGRVTTIARASRPRLPVRESDVRRFIDSVEARFAGAPPADLGPIVELLEITPPLDSMASFDRMWLDDSGNVWVDEARQPGDPERWWSVFDTGGRWLGRVRGPDGFTAAEFGSDYVLGFWQDAVGVEHVRMYGLSRGGGGA